MGIDTRLSESATKYHKVRHTGECRYPEVAWIALKLRCVLGLCRNDGIGDILLVV
jgi:hypothetical protein